MYLRLTRIPIVLALLLSALAPALAQKLNIKETRLPNGLKVLTLEDHSAPVVSFSVWYRVGSRNEHEGITGCSHLLEHMMFKGTKDYRAGEISRLLFVNGAHFNASTYLDWTNYYETLSSDRLELAMQIESSRMTGSLIDPKEMASEMTVVRSELEGDENDPGTLLNQAVWAAAFQSHPYHWPVIGWRSDVEHVSRNTLYQYYRSHYGPNNATVILIGDFDTARALQMARKYFGPLVPIPTPPPVYTQESPQRGERRVIVRREGNLPMVTLAYHIPSIKSPDMYAMDVLSTILGAGRSGRLYQKLVETQLAVSADAGDPTLKDPSLFLASATVRPGVASADVEKALLAELERVQKEPVTDEELQKAVHQIEADFVYARESVTSEAEQIGYYAAIQDWRYVTTYLDHVRKVTKADLQRVATAYFTADNRTVGWFEPSAPSTAGGPGGPHSEGAARVERGAHAQRPIPLPKTAPRATEKRRIVRMVLPNGIVLLVHENHSNPTIALDGSLNAGGVFDPPDRPGLAGMTAGLLDRGTEAHNSLQIATALESVAAQLSIAGGNESVEISGHALKKDFGREMELLGEMLRRPTFPRAELDKLRQQSLAGLEQEKDDPGARASRAFGRAVYPAGHPFRPETLEEDAASLKAMTREEVLDFYQKHYGPDTLILAVAGDITPEVARAAVEKVLGDWPRNPAAPKLQVPPVPLQSQPVREVITIPDRSEVQVIFGQAGLLKRSDPDFYAAQVMNMTLGGDVFNSRLGAVIRDEQGLAYEVDSSFDASIVQGPWEASLGTNPQNVDRAVASLRQVLQEYLKNGATQREVDEAVAYLTGTFPLRLETNAGISVIMRAMEFYHLGMDYLDRYASNYRAVTVAQVHQAARKHLHPESATLVISGSYPAK